MNVLVVDDDSSTRLLLEGALRRDGWSVLSAENGGDAWDIHSRANVHLVVSDWRMPGLDGLELCRRVRASRSAAYTYFILISATNVARDDYETAMRSGVDDFLVKPLDFVQMDLRLGAARRMLVYANRLRELESIIPICSYCRRLRDDKDSYHAMESYFARHAGVTFSHGVCPECMERVSPMGGSR
jgi:DNA-binding response OmpR family regulator